MSVKEQKARLDIKPVTKLNNLTNSFGKNEQGIIIPKVKS
jgi:hypothetical protein